MQNPVTITGSTHEAIPAWAWQQRKLLSEMSTAALRYAERYTRPDGTLIWARDEWKGMDGSDDAYESVYNFPLLYALGGHRDLLPMAQHIWEGITRQFTAYGQIHREFDSAYDWMHHGESSLFLYYLSLAGNSGDQFRERARRFADFYTGADPLAPNYDRALRMIRAPLNGSRGPLFATTAEDWTELRGIYSQYAAPFEDVPGIRNHIADWTDPATFAILLHKFNEHIARGDVPINLMATTLVTHAYLHTGEARYRDWVLDYTSAWAERAAHNDGILPDNVGLSGKIGEYNNGRWWGGYYGWGWPHGGRTLIESTAVGGMNATLLTRDAEPLDLFRSQWDWLWRQGDEKDGAYRLPFWLEDHSRWRDWRAVDAHLPIAVWNLTQADEDRERIEAFPKLSGWDGVREVGWGDEANAQAWYRFVTGHFDAFPEQVLGASQRFLDRRIAAMQVDPIDPHEWPAVTPFENDVHHWLNRNPVTCEGLVMTMWGAPMPIYHGGLLHASLRYYDEAADRAGLPEGVAALIERVDPAGVDVQLVNLNADHGVSVLVQAGSFSEHTITRVTDKANGSATHVGGGQERVRVELGKGTCLRARIDMQRLVNPPRYE